MTRQLLNRELQDRLHTWEELVGKASQVIVFGSRAAGLASPASDLDILCVGSGPRIKSGHLDLLWLKPEQLETERWLQSELATHIAAYGHWLRGEDEWKQRVRAGPSTLERKRHQLIERIAALNQHWSDLSAGYRQHYLTLVRRDLQRLLLLRKQCPIPPTPLLDREWSTESELPAAITRLAEADGFLSPKELETLISHAAEV